MRVEGVSEMEERLRKASEELSTLQKELQDAIDVKVRLESDVARYKKSDHDSRDMLEKAQHNIGVCLWVNMRARDIKSVCLSVTTVCVCRASEGKCPPSSEGAGGASV